MIEPDAVAMVTAAIVGPMGPVTGAEITPITDAAVAAPPRRTAPAHPAAEYGRMRVVPTKAGSASIEYFAVS